MKKIIFSLLCVALIFSSCGDNAVQVNSTITSEIQSVNDAMQTISDLVSNDKYDEAVVLCDSLNAKAVAAQEKVKKLDSKTAVSYKQSAVDYLAYVGDKGPGTFKKAIDMFKAAKVRELADVTSGKQSPDKINSGPDFDEARKLIKDFRIELKKYQTVLFEKQEKFIEANGLE